MNAIEKEEIMNSLTHMERNLQKPSTPEYVQNQVARLADILWKVVDHLEAKE